MKLSTGKFLIGGVSALLGIPTLIGLTIAIIAAIVAIVWIYKSIATPGDFDNIGVVHRGTNIRNATWISMISAIITVFLFLIYVVIIIVAIVFIEPLEEMAKQTITQIGLPADLSRLGRTQQVSQQVPQQQYEQYVAPEQGSLLSEVQVQPQQM